MKSLCKKYGYVIGLGLTLAVFNCVPWEDWRFYAIAIPMTFLIEWKAA